ncbi:long-chain-fatty-acid--CoA ligase [Tumebacillus sp. DT12]|uniref:Long-chain-fatty-acid--CoA ligase n=1 Tax=Tumebacillus lacus TaxID=2995335 RepID=A0ABT3X473_9BACL|nr:long-chain-fatty-acid--CoA ligase [Tumebacillus lacus]MCX7571698.1 long-chain-fatty-acid--CoA ligase [Tumebacillus lacus]
MNLSENLRRAAANHPDVAAILFLDKTIQYRDLDAQVDRFAAGLAQLGLKKGSRVAMLLGNSPEFIIAYYAIARLGAVSVPINPLYTPGEIQYILADAGVEAVVSVAPLAPAYQMMKPTLPALQHVILVGGEAPGFLSFGEVFADSTGLIEPGIADDDVAVILYTSGTTGKPKGAMLSHRNVCSNAQYTGDFLQFLQTDTVVAVLPMFHVFCMTVCLNAPIYRGATLLVLPRFSPTETSKAILTAKATVFAGVPTMYNYLLQHPECEPSDLQSLRLAISGGAAMPVAVLKAFEQKFNVMVSEGYGLSEASPVVTFNPLDRERKPGTIGVSIPSVEVRVVGEDGRECGPGEVGELICRGPNVMLGYLNKPEETALALRDGWLYTGDLVTIDEEGYVTVVDRKKDMIIVGGFNVYPREVEEVLFKHPAVAEAAVVGIPDMNRGEAVKAFVALKQENGVSAEDLIAFCKENLAPYKVPAEIDVLAELPKNSTGKILRRELKKGNEPKISQ